MTIQYKNAIKSLADTNLNTVLTISTTAVAIVKSVYFTNSSTGTILCNASMSCLLYTSPSPRDRTRSRMPSSA